MNEWVCRNCNALNLDTMRFCQVCHQPRATDRQTSPTEPVNPAMQQWSVPQPDFFFTQSPPLEQETIQLAESGQPAAEENKPPELSASWPVTAQPEVYPRNTVRADPPWNPTGQGAPASAPQPVYRQPKEKSGKLRVILIAVNALLLAANIVGLIILLR